MAGATVSPHRARRRSRFGRAVAAGFTGALVITLAVAQPAAALDQCDPDQVRYSDQEPPALARLSAAAAWQVATGNGVVVAVVDSGVDAGNAHLRNAVLPGVDLVASVPGQVPAGSIGGGSIGDGSIGDGSTNDGEAAAPARDGRVDTAGHGTAIAGQIAAREVPNSQVVGLARDATLLPVRVYYGTDQRSIEAGAGPRTDRIAQGIRYAAENGAEIINVSLSTTVDHDELREAVEAATAAGALVVASAGNRLTTDHMADSPRYPAAYPQVLAVTAVDDYEQPTLHAIGGDHVDIAGPGSNVLTTFHAAGDCMLATDEVSTSFATAYVSAAAALLAERFPNETPAQWAYRLKVTAMRAQRDVRDDEVGWGVVRPFEALTFVDDGTAVGPENPVHQVPRAEEGPVPTLAVTPIVDDAAPTRAVALWWVLGGVTLLAAATLISRMRSGS